MNMAFFMHMNLRHNLTKTLKIANKIGDFTIISQQVRRLPRWAHRRPIRVVDEDDSTRNNNYIEKLKIEREAVLSRQLKDEIQVQDEESIREKQFASKLEKEEDFGVESQPISKKNKILKNNEDVKSKSKKERKLEEKETMKLNKLKESAAKAGVPLYTKLPDNDPKLSKLMLIAKSKNKKTKRSHIVLEGKRLIKDAITAGYVPEQIFFSRVSDAADLRLPDGIQLYKIPYKDIKLWSDVSTPPGIMGFLKTPDMEKKEPGKDALPLTIICDNVRDPGNLGTILRGAAGVGCQKLILMKGCVDLWEPKVLRSGAGAHFRTPIVSHLEWVDIESHITDNATVFLADSNIMSMSSEPKDQASGSETNLSFESYEKCLSTIPVIPYFAADYPNCGPIILIIGGETEGLSIDSFKFAHERESIRLNIPLSNEVDSLNSGIALGIIVFEMKRQFLRKMSKQNNKSHEEDITFEEQRM